MSETDTAALRVLADNIKHAPHIWAHDAVKPLRTAADTIDALRAEASAASSMARVLANEYARAERAEGTIAAAPHTADCGVRESRNGDPAPRPCTCWKAEYARASQPAPTGEAFGERHPLRAPYDGSQPQPAPSPQFALSPHAESCAAWFGDEPCDCSASQPAPEVEQ